MEAFRRGRVVLKDNVIEYNSYLCDECAEKHGAVWPEGHIASYFMGKCNVCKEQKSLSCTGDWNWPDKNSKGGRD